MSENEVTLVIRQDDVYSEHWTYGRYEIDGHYADREGGGELKLTNILFNKQSDVVAYLHKHHSANEWMYDIFRIFKVYDYQIENRSAI